MERTTEGFYKWSEQGKEVNMVNKFNKIEHYSDKELS
jgi:hypothetical protein